MTRDFSLNGWVVRPQGGSIEHDGHVERVEPKAMAVLLRLAQADGEAVTHKELFEAVWPGAVISDATLLQCIVELRQAFGETARDGHIIETIPEVGFRLMAPVVPFETPHQKREPHASETDPGWVLKPSPLQSIIFIAVFFAILAISAYLGSD